MANKSILKKLEEKKINMAIKIEKQWKKCVEFRDNTKSEIDFFRNILKNIMLRVNESYKNNIIFLSEYKKTMETISSIIENLNFFPSKLTIRFLKSYSNYSILLKLAKIKIMIMDLTNSNGSTDINELIYLYIGDYKKNECVDKDYIKNMVFFRSFFKTIQCELYESDIKNNITFKLVTYGKKKKNTSLTLTSYQIDKPSVNKYKVFTKNLFLKTMGAKIFIPVKSKLLILYGYFINDDLNQYQKEAIFEQKFSKITSVFSNLDINDEFKNNFLKTLSITDFLVNSPNQIASMCLQYHTELIKFKSKNISHIVKEFIVNDIDKQKYIITLLLLDTYDNNCIYLAHLLFDLLKSDHQIPSPKNASIIFESLHWHLKKIFRDGDILVQDVNDKISNFSEDRIPYEKRIHLMKASDYVKSKAMDKLKEINNSKNGESNAKAQQYLDGLLKVPFGIYKKEFIRYKLDELNIKYNKLINIISREIVESEENNSLCDTDLTNTAKLSEIIDGYKEINKNPINISKFNRNIKEWIKNVLSQTFTLESIFDINQLSVVIKKLKTNELKDFCSKCSIQKIGKKCDITDRILKGKYSNEDINCFKKILKLENIYIQLQDTEQFVTILSSLEQISNIWSKYIELQSKYFKDISRRLDDTVYGLDDAKKQIKRLLAQWVNGNDQGYVFGFEGPPGTGKTTLAKNAIANCLRDELDNPRPFVFIALGGSSNGSTLEGHNYTYVGSTWGRIIDGIIDSKAMNPIIYIDELDKISKTEHGREIIGILTHLTDPSQNTEFTDKYFSGIKFDISKCLIIFSYNDPGLIDKILLDRIQRVKITSLNKVDKVMVSQTHIIPEILNNIGFTENEIILNETELIHIIDTYTYEAGARKLKEKLYELYREINLKYLIDGDKSIPFTITKKFIDEIFDNYDKVDIKLIHDTPTVGLVNGLFATAAGIGGITIIETYKYLTSNHLELKLTGMQGDVMKESMTVAKTLALNLIPENILESLKNIEDNPDKKFGIHIHCPEGSTPKDGPSAGTAITVAIVSLLCKIPVLNTIALTGEISLCGNVMPIGGLESKLDGGKAAGVTRILCPRKNEKDLTKIRKRVNPPEDKNLKVEIIDTIYEALDRCLLIPNGKKAKDYFRRLG